MVAKAGAGDSSMMSSSRRYFRSSSSFRAAITSIAALVAFFVLLISSLSTPATAQLCTNDGKLCDKHERCTVWAEQDGECFKNKEYMREYCPASCSKENKLSKNRVNIAKGGECDDRHERCHLWAQSGECDDNEVAMKKYCPKSCGYCGGSNGAKGDDEYYDPSCVDDHENCDFWADHGECDNNPNYMRQNCAKACGLCPKRKRRTQATADSSLDDDAAVLDETENFGTRQAAEGDSAVSTLELIRSTIEYMNSDATRNLPKKVRENCMNRHELCAFWATLGECEGNMAFMATNCAPSCKSCDQIDMATRCPPLKDAVPALKPGDLNKMFERIVATAPGNKTDSLTEEERRKLEETNMPLYTVTVHSRPSDEPATEVSAANDKSLPPWVVTFDNFLTDEECDALVQLGHKYVYKRSEDVGAVKFDGSHDSVQSESRTSENAWCSSREGCREEEVPKRVHERMSTVMQIPANNSEDLQMLKYETGQFYRAHHDFIGHQVNRQCGPRILTFFLYLSDVEEGGGTNFPDLDLTIMPKKGRALLWPSVLDSNPMKKDGRTIHQALDVVKGIKFAANGWIHQYDYVTPQERGCT